MFCGNSAADEFVVHCPNDLYIKVWLMDETWTESIYEKGKLLKNDQMAYFFSTASIFKR